MKVKQRNMNQSDIYHLNESGMNGEFLAQSRIVLEFEDDEGHRGIMYIETNIVERLGLEYIAENTVLEYSKVCEEYFAKLSQNKYYNDPVRFPPLTEPVEFVEMMSGENTEIYRGIENGHYYMRQIAIHKNFARWLSASKSCGCYIDNCEIRANVTFEHNGQTEMVTYDDWNGNAAYSNTFNPNFNQK